MRVSVEVPNQSILFWEELLALNLTFSPGEKEQLSRVSIVRQLVRPIPREYFQSRGECKK
jgi:hypothetical protein